MASLLPCIIKNILIQFLTGMLSADLLIHTQIVNVQRSDIRHDIIPDMLLKGTEYIAHHLIILICGDEHRSVIIFKNVHQLCRTVFLRRSVKKIRPSVMMNHIHLYQEFSDSLNVFSLCSSDLHLILLPQTVHPEERRPCSQPPGH